MHLFKVDFKVCPLDKVSSSFHFFFPYSVLLHFYLTLSIFHFVLFCILLLLIHSHPVAQYNGFHRIWSTLSFLSILVWPSDLLQFMSHWCYLICPIWDSELIIVSVINLTGLHQFHSTIYVMGTVSVTLDWCVYSFVLTVHVHLTFHIASFLLLCGKIVCMISHVFYLNLIHFWWNIKWQIINFSVIDELCRLFKNLGH